MFKTEFKDFKITIFMTKPVPGGAIVHLTNKNSHYFLNYLPVNIPVEMKSIFFDLYGKFTVKPTTLPFVMLHLET